MDRLNPCVTCRLRKGEGECINRRRSYPADSHCRPDLHIHRVGIHNRTGNKGWADPSTRPDSLFRDRFYLGCVSAGTGHNTIDRILIFEFQLLRLS